MVTEFYKAYLKSDKWRAKRQECFAYHGKRCKACGKTSGHIHVHHLDYTRLGRERVSTDLMPLCVMCHKDVTTLYRRNRRRGLRRVTLEFVRARRKALEKKKTTGNPPT